MSDTKKLAQWFVIVILKRPWTKADWGGTVIAHAKKLLGMGYKLDEIQSCALAMVKNPGRLEGWNQEWKLQYLTTLLRGEPPYIEQWLRPPDPPPVYEGHNYDLWIQNWGRKAIRLGQWDGLYLPVNDEHRLGEEALRIILGDEYVQKSLDAKLKQGRARLARQGNTKTIGGKVK